MENPISRNGRRYQPQPPRYPFSRSPSFGYEPVYYPFNPTRETHQTFCPEKNSAPKVVQIPVHFVGSEQSDRPGSALKIQKVFRGFLVRKCLKKIKDIKAQVDVIGEKLSEREAMELIRRDGKERLRMNESLMSLLFKLDSICGIDFGVRACRKAVIRKAIALQEKIDGIVNGETVDDGQIIAAEADSSTSMEIEGNDGEVDIVDVGVDREVKVVNYVEEDEDDVIQDVCDLEQAKVKEGDDCTTNREMLERLTEDNGKMMSLMTQLLEGQENQMRVINALTLRVDMLEKAFLCESRLRKKKKNKKAAAAAAASC